MPIPPPSLSQPVLDFLTQIHAGLADVNEGEVASYIPELTKANPDWFGICLVTATGSVYEVGDTRQPFTIQSISKPFVYGMALEENGRADVLNKVGVEPTGDVFNSISLEPDTGRPRNPMINAGAIATTGLISGLTLESRLKRVLATFGNFAGRELSLDDEVYRSESETGHRNRAIGHMLRNFEVLTTDPMPTVELYFKQCSISVTCHDLGIMAATLANRGMNPVTGKHAMRGEYVESVLSVMESCGTYDFAGEWIYNVGFPAKSGVAGGIIAVLPGQLGIGVYSPRLDERGNSVRGIRVCQELSRQLDLHQLSRATMGRVTIRTKLNATTFNSSRVRTTEECVTLRERGGVIQIYQLQGHLNFSTSETFLHEIVENSASFSHLIIDFKRVIGINECSCRMIQSTLEKFAQSAKSMIFACLDHLPLLRRMLKANLGARFDDLFRTFSDVDLALEWAENRLLDRDQDIKMQVHTGEYELFAGLTAEELAVIEPHLERRTYKMGDALIKAGDTASEIFLLARGHVSVLINLPSGATRRLASFSAGMAFGEMAVIDRSPRSATIVADTEVTCDLLKLENLSAVEISHPRIKIKLLENLSLGLSLKLRKANRELSLFE